MTNVAAISYIGSNVKDNRRVMLSGLLYASGRIITYTVLGLLLVASLIPLAVENQSSVLYPAVYGFGTGLPIVVLAIVLAFSARSLSRIFERITDFDRWARRVTGSVFLLVGIYFCLKYIFGLLG